MQLKKCIHGSREFKGLVDITDPCYDKDVWCRTSKPVKEGTYTCVTWEEENTVAIIGIYKDGEIPDQEEMTVIGNIGVDAGLAGFFMNKQDFSQEEWSEFCKKISKGHAWSDKHGFYSSSGFGDGDYDVYGKREGDEYTALEIHFFD